MALPQLQSMFPASRFNTASCFLSVTLAMACTGHATAAEPPFAVVAVLKDASAFAGAHDVELQGDYAYVTGKGGSLAIVHVADPAKPRVVWSRQDSKAFDDSETVLPLGPHLLVGSRDFVTLDVRDPAKPVVLKTIADRPRIEHINGMVRRGTILFAANKAGWVDAFDISKPEKPTLFGALDIRSRDKLQSPHDVDLLGDHVVITDPNAFGRRNQPGQIAVYRVADDAKSPVLPAERWTLLGKVSDPRLAGANRVRVFRSFAVAAASISPKAEGGDTRKPLVVTVDLEKPESPVVAAAVPFPSARGPNGLCVAGRVAFAAGGQTILAVDLSNPREPAALAAFRSDELFPAGQDDAHDLAYRDGYLFATGQNSHTFGVLKIVDPKIRELADAKP
jgi:hypothetical protein